MPADGPKTKPAQRRPRLDERVHAEGLAETRTLARSLILAGRVLVDEAPVDKPGTRVADDAVLRLKGEPRRYVSRGGDKLEGALADLGIEVAGRSCLDVGASTGGFTDCLLQHGARHVVAVDVGRAQLHERLARDERVTSFEGTHARRLPDLDIPAGIEPFGLVVADVSFISLRLLLEAIASRAPRAEWLLLVKPQFEVGRERVGKGGVVRDDAVRQAAADDVVRAAEALGRHAIGRADCRLAGPKGNVEIFVHLSRKPHADSAPGLESATRSVDRDR
jgi:23S rRNA (cytidine1920-2'-O)/16S rRNA (cytidine1409-2'-O)-methyltransferase